MSDIEEIVEGRWDCPSCGHRLNRGSVRKCAGCHLERGDGVKFYDISGDDYESADIVRDKKQLAAARAGADLVCEICRGLNQRNAEFCVACGNILMAGSREQGLSPLPTSADPVAIAKAREERRKKRVANVLIGYGIGVLLVMILAIGSCVSSYITRHAPRDIEVTVQSVDWVKTVEYQKYLNVTDRGWSVPYDGTEINKEWRDHPTEKRQVGTREVRTPQSHQEVDRVERIPYQEPVYENVKVGTKRVKTGSEDLGNGHFKNTYAEKPVYERRQTGTVTKYREKKHYKTVKDPDKVTYVPIMVPVQKWYYTYTQDRWVSQPASVLRGSTQPWSAPRWPEIPNLAVGGSTVIGTNRIIAKKETYTLNLVEVAPAPKDDGMFHGMRTYSGSSQDLFSLAGKNIIVTVSDSTVKEIKPDLQVERK